MPPKGRLIGAFGAEWRKGWSQVVNRPKLNMVRVCETVITRGRRFQSGHSG